MPWNGKGWLDTHFSFVNTHFRSYVEYGKYIIIEEDIHGGLLYKVGIQVTMFMLLNLTNLECPTLKRRFKANIGSRSMYNLRWGNVRVNIYEASNTSTTEIIKTSKLGRKSTMKNQQP